MDEPEEDGRYLCEACTLRWDITGDCPRCPEEPLLDLWDPAVIEMLQHFDELAWRKRMGQVSAVCALICSPTLLLGLVANVLALPAFGLATAALTAVVYPFFPARRVTPERVGRQPATRRRPRDGQRS